MSSRHRTFRLSVMSLACLALAAALVAGGSASSASAAGAGALARPSTVAYRGLATWVDIYDTAVFDSPATAVRAMALRGVRTVFVETGNSGASSAVHRPAAMRRLIEEAHRRHMRVVAWYLPTLVSPSRDYERVASAIRFRTAGGQRFDSFALDIESSAVKPASTRNTRVVQLSQRIRRLVGPGYPLGAIIPSPVGVRTNLTYWRPFPYQDLARTYDVFVPMSYYTYHGDGAAAAYADAKANVRILREQRGCANKPIHLVGGIGNRSSVAEVKAFVRVVRETGCQGASLYDWTCTTGGHWAELAVVGRSAR